MLDSTTRNSELFVTAYTLSSALGVGNGATLDSLTNMRGGLREFPLEDGRSTWLGMVPGSTEPMEFGDLKYLQSISNQILAKAGVQDGFPQAVERARTRYGADRIGCFVGTITSGLMHLEDCYGHEGTTSDVLGSDPRTDAVVNLHSAVDYCRELFGITGLAGAVSTACSSSAKVFAVAARHIRAGLCDAAVVAGVDAAGGTIIYGFRSLGLLSASPCRPWDSRRNGISVGEAGGFALIEAAPNGPDDLALLGYGESCDAYHMTSPHPEGAGARAAIEAALRRAGLAAGDIDYVNLHGSGTPANDASEDAAVYGIFGDRVCCSSTKGWTGHTQGAAGITEAVICLLAIRHGLLPATLNNEMPDSGLRCRILLDNKGARVRRALSNSFGFGGNNCSLIFGEAA